MGDCPQRCRTGEFVRAWREGAGVPLLSPGVRGQLGVPPGAWQSRLPT
jgi:hypothetical protein